MTINHNPITNFELGLWYIDGKSRRLEDKVYLYKCKYVDKDIAVLGKYFDGACINTFSTPSKGNKYQISDKNDINQLVDFYKKDKFNTMCSIVNSLSSIQNDVNVLSDLERFFQKQESTEGYVASYEAKSCDKLYEEMRSLAIDSNYLEIILNFLSKP